MSSSKDFYPLPDTALARLNSRGLIEIVDKLTGRIMCVQTSYRDLLQAKSESLTRIDTPEGPVWIEKGINFDIVSHIKSMPYSKVLGDLLCQAVAEGTSLVKACARFNLDYADVKRWEREHESFRNDLVQARKDRAEYLHDKILDKSETASEKTQIDALKYLAEKGDPDKYGAKNDKGAVAPGITVVNIMTGISRDPVPLEKDVTPSLETIDANKHD